MSFRRRGILNKTASHPWSDTDPHPITLDHIRLDGFFYALGTIELQGSFSAYGSLYAGKGFLGPGAENVQVWYNNRFRPASYEDVPSVVRLKGTWHLLPIENM